MRRGKNQVLFRYLPECVVDHSDTQTIAKVEKWNSREVKDINKLRLISKIERNLERFQKRRIYPPKKSYNDYVFLEPISVKVNLFPLTFSCKKCGKILKYKDIRHFKSETKGINYKCSTPNCRGDLIQLDLIHYHECGKMESLWVKKCEIHGYKNIILNKNNSDSTKNWQWKCRICGNNLGPITGYCTDCNKRMHTAPFRKSQVFYPHSITQINVPGIREEKIYFNENSHKMILAKYLELLGEFEFSELLDASKRDNELDEVNRVIENLREQGMDEKQIQMVYKQINKPDKYEEKNKIINHVNSYINLEEEVLKDTSISIYEYIETLNLEEAKSLRSVIEKAEIEQNPNLEKVKRFPNRLEDIGIINAYVISDLPMVSAVFGYTRGSVNASECTLRSFKEDAAFRNKTPIYVNSTTTEGILLELDRYKILKWLEINGIVDQIPDKDDVVSQKAWFINNVILSNIPTYDEIENDPITKYIYKLIHTISHSLLIRASGLVGLDKDSLAEIIMPNIPAIIIYSNNIHDFQLGGMHTLFENSIIPWIDLAETGIEKCLYDPVCIEGEASCHACLHTSEISCTHFNRDLGRDVLIGKKSGDIDLIGFWENRFRDLLED